ncbi:MAG: hypothetical protein MUE85_03020 [Microscillaceae bacterium]|nr:hypothetical protein [Microscillaceae bacterium]
MITKYIKWILLSLSGLLLLTFTACQKEFDYEPVTPKVVFTGGNTVAAAPGGTNKVRYEARALAGITNIKITRSINNAAPTDFDNLTYDGSQVLIANEFDYTNTNALNDKVVFSIELTDRNGQKSAASSFTIEVGKLYITETTTVGTTSVIRLAPPGGFTKAVINDDFTFRGDRKYWIEGIIELDPARTYTFQPGAEFYARTGVGVAVAAFRVPAGKSVVMAGTKDKPIIMTSDKILKGETPAPSDWQGLEVFGLARNPSGNAADNSGTYSYIRVEFGGKSATEAGNEASIRFNDVGNATTIEYLQSFKSSEVGIRFNGGFARAKYLVSTDALSHSYRLDDITYTDGGGNSAFNGKGQFWIAQHNSNSESIVIRDGASGLLSNVTIIGNNNTNNALRVRDATSFGRIFNTIAAFNGTGLRLFAAPTTFNLSDNPVIAHGRYFSNTSNYHSTTTAYDNQLNNTTEAVAGIAIGDFVPDAAPTGIDASTIDAFFTNVNFIGAVQNAASDWTADGSWCKNSDGSIR